MAPTILIAPTMTSLGVLFASGAAGPLLSSVEESRGGDCSCNGYGDKYHRILRVLHEVKIIPSNSKSGEAKLSSFG